MAQMILGDSGPDVDISLIQQYIFCPKQAKNRLDDLGGDDRPMSGGRDYHQHLQHLHENIRESFRRTRKHDNLADPSIMDLSRAINASISTGTDAKFVEIYVKSKKYKIHGRCDEIRVQDGYITIIEYKTTFSREKKNEHIEGFVAQTRAYAAALKEYYKYDGKLSIIIKRVFLEYDAAYENFIDREEIGYISADGNTITAEGYMGRIEDIFESEFNLKTDMDEVQNVTQKIRKGDFKHTPHKSKCDKCQYQGYCTDSLFERKRD